MKIIEYEEKYLEDIKDLLVELEEYIISIDQDHLDQLHPDYREKMTLKELSRSKDNNGKCYLAIEDDKAIGVIIGMVGTYDEYDYLDYKCPKRGVVQELIVSKNARSKGTGSKLIEAMEKYFKSIGCEYVLIEVFAYNDLAINFYHKHGYHARGITDIKKI
jgi:ribosomal protein S18 acetylase RimI-like enzyme